MIINGLTQKMAPLVRKGTTNQHAIEAERGGEPLYKQLASMKCDLNGYSC